MLWISLFFFSAVEGNIRAYSTRYIDLTYENWMGNSLGKIGDKSLKQITLSGTHDSGAYNLTDALMPDAESDTIEDLVWLSEHLMSPVGDIIRDWSESQDWTFYQQLQGGMRYLDLRAGWDNSTCTWKAFHMQIGNSILDLLTEVRAFLDSHPKEIVILEVSHFDGYPTQNDIFTLELMIVKLFNGLFIPTSISLNTTINTLLYNDYRVLIALDSFPVTTEYIWNTDILYNSYANTPSLAEMKSYNDDKVQEYMNGEHSSQLFKISWTLTPNSTTILTSILPWELNSLIELADLANSEFVDYWADQKIKGNKLGDIVLFDHFEFGWIMPVFYDMNGIS